MSSPHPLLAKLNPQQAEAVQCTEGPLLIFAGAGSGKTRVLTHRVAWLIQEKRVFPSRILAVTFTNKAAQEMRERIVSLVGQDSASIWIGTFHAICARILRKDGDKIGIPRDFTIYDDNDQMSLVTECLRQLNIDEKKFPPRVILSAISRSKEKLIDSEEYARHNIGYFEGYCHRVYSLYEEKLRQNNALDFDDLLMKTVRLMEQRTDALQYYQDRLNYLLVDEYQDVNYAQYMLLKLLASARKNLCVVGDDDQSIYAFRGADVSLILRFEKDFPEARIIKLEQNYRSTSLILEAAHHVVSKNSDRADKRLWTANEGGRPPVLHESENEQEEALYVALQISQKISRENRKYRDFAVLYRTNAQSRSFEEVFFNFGIPYRLIGGIRFYERKEVKDIISYLRVIQNPQDTVSLKRIMNVPARGIGAASLTHMEEKAREMRMPLWEIMRNPGYVPNLTARAKNAVHSFVALLSDIQSVASQKSVTEITQEVLEKSGYIHVLEEDKSPEGQGRLDNVREMISVTTEFDVSSDDRSLSAFLEQVSLVSDLDAMNQTANSVTLLTLHAAKGLEFPIVFLAGMEEGVFPHSRSLYNNSDIEEERRLCYVGITRAKEELYLTHAYRRTLFGSSSYNPPSRFIKDIPSEIFEGSSGVTGFNPTPQPVRAEKLWVDSPVSPSRMKGVSEEGDYRPGCKVKHATFGIGVVLSVQKNQDDSILSVAFPGQGVKKLALSAAPIEPYNR